MKNIKIEIKYLDDKLNSILEIVEESISKLGGNIKNDVWRVKR